MPVVRCSPLTPAQFAAAHALAVEFLGEADDHALATDYAAHPELAIVLEVDGTVAGVAFGHPNGDGGATLEGITVDDAHTARGLGSRLLARFERATADAGYTNVSLGSGPGYVEHFYLKNGYHQTEYMIIIPYGQRQSLSLGGLTVLRERHGEPNELVLNVATPQGYDPAVQAELMRRLGAREVCCIFRKPVQP